MTKTEWPVRGSWTEEVIAFLYVVSGVWLLYAPVMIYEVANESLLNIRSRKKTDLSSNRPNTRSLSLVPSSSDVGDRSISVSRH